MAKKLPKGYSVKTIVEEVGFNDMYRWQILKDKKVIKESHARVDDRTECREAGVKFLFEIVVDG